MCDLKIKEEIFNSILNKIFYTKNYIELSAYLKRYIYLKNSFESDNFDFDYINENKQTIININLAKIDLSFLEKFHEDLNVINLNKIDLINCTMDDFSFTDIITKTNKNICEYLKIFVNIILFYRDQIDNKYLIDYDDIEDNINIPLLIQCKKLNYEVLYYLIKNNLFYYDELILKHIIKNTPFNYDMLKLFYENNIIFSANQIIMIFDLQCLNNDMVNLICKEQPNSINYDYLDLNHLNLLTDLTLETKQNIINNLFTEDETNIDIIKQNIIIDINNDIIDQNNNIVNEDQNEDLIKDDTIDFFIKTIVISSIFSLIIYNIILVVNIKELF